MEFNRFKSLIIKSLFQESLFISVYLWLKKSFQKVSKGLVGKCIHGFDGNHLFATIATISVTFVGFSSIVVVFRQVQGSSLDQNHVFLVRFFIEMGLIVTGFALLPLLLGVWGIPAGLIWGYSSAAFALGHLAYIVTLFRRRRRNAAGRFSLGRNFLLIVISIGWISA